MILAYGSVWWWKIFSPDQCSGINRFVAIFAVPLLSFHFISTNNPYAMNFRFIIQVVILVVGCSSSSSSWPSFGPRAAGQVPNAAKASRPFTTALFRPCGWVKGGLNGDNLDTGDDAFDSQL
ncbi:hypothetical protein RJ640_030783 [Escallonia rubra]|uniref:Uncharacterized protein n=1 Tax=Escallonia rubra TaxID=112253 RepID=A0AA88QAD6_9ASTE|nr:hypothetical protein RJ640_030783 [Escallonia rubra]